MRNRTFALICTLFFLLQTFTASAFSQQYPSKPIKLIVTTSPGTATDGVGRFLAEHLGKEFDVPVIVENKVGANGVIAAEFVAKAPADGYTLMMTASTHYVNGALYPELSYDVLKSFKAVARVASTDLVLVVPSSSPFNSIADVIDFARENPGELTYASGGSGSTPHLAGALLFSMAKTDALHIPYNGGNAGFSATVGAQVNMAFWPPLTSIGMIDAGRLKALASTGMERSPSTPDVPTVAESGFPSYENISTLGVMAPAGVNNETISIITAAIAKITDTKEFNDFCMTRGLTSAFQGSDDYAKSGAKEFEYWSELVKLSGAGT